MKVSELTGALLDFWVAKAAGHTGVHINQENEDLFCKVRYHGNDGYYSPSTNWAQCGPIIEREKITVITGAFGVPWTACEDWSRDPECNKWIDGETYLIAAMRCYVASKFGDEVPDEPKPFDYT